MKRIAAYVSALLWLVISCQQSELHEIDRPSCMEDEVVVSFSVALPENGTATKARGDDPSVDVRSLHLVVFDENGYFVECREAELTSSGAAHGTHQNEREFKVTLRKTDKERIIHVIANCPIDQIYYGHENDVMTNLYVTKGTPVETAYWYRAEVWYILTGDDGKLVPEIAEVFRCIPLLRNYASVTVENTAVDFAMESYGIYNTIDIGTVAPYNISSHSFQLFTEGDRLLTYDELLGQSFEGHALAQAALNTTLGEADMVAPGENVYMYERKISVRTDEEHKWSESPAHIIIKGRYAGASASSYYKVDMVRNVDGHNEYYNILRNFRYRFIVSSVTGSGYPTLEEAMANPAGNNLSGATDTQGFTNVSDGLGRIFVNYTDTTLVSSGNIKLKYKYIPSIQNYDQVANDRVVVTGILDGTGSVIKGVVNHDYDVGDGWAEVTFSIQDVGAVTHMQDVILNVQDNQNLHKTVRYRLQKQYRCSVSCNPSKVAKVAGRPMEVLVSLPGHLTEDLFPLDLAIEVADLTLSPDASVANNIMPVEPSLSIVPEKTGKNSFHFVKTIESYDDYLSLPIHEGSRSVRTYWLTTKAESASTVYVHNKYFELAWDDFINAQGFSMLAFPDGVKEGAGTPVRFVFNMNTVDPVTVTLTNLVNASGESVFVYNPSAVGLQELTLYTVNETGAVAVHLASDAYEDAELTAEQMSDIVIEELVVRFTYTYGTAPAAGTVVPSLTLTSGTLTYGDARTVRTGSNRNYTYTTTYTDVTIKDADMNTTMNVSYQYSTGGWWASTYTYTGSAKVGDLINNPMIHLEEQ